MVMLLADVNPRGTLALCMTHPQGSSVITKRWKESKTYSSVEDGQLHHSPVVF